MNNILENLIKDAECQLAGRENDLRIDNIIVGKTLYTMKDCDKVFTDMNFCLILFENSYGFSYFQDDVDYSLSRFVNKNALNVLNESIPNYMRVAIADAMHCLINNEKLSEPDVFTGDIRKKAKKRAEVLLAHIPSGSKILLLGAATEIIDEAKSKGCGLRVVDLESQKVGLKFNFTCIENNEVTNLQDKIKEADYIVATGMIFVSETADEVFRLTAEAKKGLVLYMETGSNFGQQLLEYGADTVLSEFFPFYDFFWTPNIYCSENKRIIYYENNYFGFWWSNAHSATILPMHNLQKSSKIRRAI